MKKPTGTYAAVLTPHVAHKMVHCGRCTLVSIAIEALHKIFRLQCWLHLRVLSNRYTTVEESKHHHNIMALSVINPHLWMEESVLVTKVTSKLKLYTLPTEF